MTLKIPITDTIYDLKAIFGIAKLSMQAKGCDLTYILFKELPTDITDYDLRSDVNTETVADLSGLIYEVADSTFYRKNEVITVYDNAGEVKGAVKVIDKPSATLITVEKMYIDDVDFALVNNDKLFVKGDEILTDNVSFIFEIETNQKHRFLLIKSSEEIANNLDITDITFKKKN